MKTTKSDKIGIAIFLFPALLLISVFFIYPVLSVAVTSFFKWNGINAPVFNGVQNYVQIFNDRVFWVSVKNNVTWVLAVCFVQVVLALLMAMVLSTKPKGWKVFRTIYFLPQVISGIAMAMLWSAVFNSEFGLLNGFLKLIGMQESTKNWLGNPKTAFISVLSYGLFYIGYYMVILMAGISGIDETYYEAATIDGASRMQMERHITIPLLRYSIMTSVTLASVYALRTFEQVYQLTNGGPANRTSVLVLYLYNQMRNNNYGGANASSVMLILTGTLVIVIVRVIFSEKKYV